MELRSGKMVPTDKVKDSSTKEDLKIVDEIDDKGNEESSKSDNVTKDQQKSYILDKLYNDNTLKEKLNKIDDVVPDYSDVIAMHHFNMLMKSINLISSRLEKMEKRQNELSQTINEMKSDGRIDTPSNEKKKSNFNEPGDVNSTGVSKSKFGSEWYADHCDDNKNMNVILSLLSTQNMKPYDPKEPYELYQAKIENYFELVKIPHKTRRAMLFNLLEGQVLQDVLDRNNQGQLLTYEELVTYLKQTYNGQTSTIEAKMKIEELVLKDVDQLQHVGKVINTNLSIIHRKEKPEVILERKVEKLAELIPSAFKYTLLQAQGLTKFEDYVAYAKLLWMNHKKALKEIQSELSKEMFDKKKDQYKSDIDENIDSINRITCYKCSKRGHKASNCTERTVNNTDKVVSLNNFIYSNKYCNGFKLCCIHVKLLNDDKLYTIKAMLDTGTTRSLLSCDVAEMLGIELDEVEVNTKVFNGETFTVKQSKVPISVELGDDTFDIKPCVRELNTDFFQMIIGQDILMNLSITIQGLNTSNDDETMEAINKTVQWIHDNHPNVIAKSKYDVGDGNYCCPETRLIEGVEPIKPVFFEVKGQTIERTKEVIDKMLNSKIIVKSDARFLHPFFIMDKKDKDGNIIGERVVGDFRSINSITMPFHYGGKKPMEMIRKLAKKKYFSTLDLSSAYHQLSIKPQGFFGIKTLVGNFEYVRLPQGAKNSAAEFQLRMDDLFRDYDNVQSYQDDLIIASSTLNDAVADVKKVISILDENSMKIEIAKAQFFGNEVKFLGYLVSGNTIRPSKENKERFSCRKKPVTVKQLKGLIASASYFRETIPRFTDKILNLLELTKGSSGKKIKWNDEAEKEYKMLCEQMGKENMILQMDPELELYITSDSSEQCIGGYASQFINNIEQPIAFFSKKLPSVLTKRNPTRTEAKAMLECIKEFSFLIQCCNKQVVCRTDHKVLLSIIKNSTDPKYMDLIEILQTFDNRVEYLQGVKNIIADDLSRNVYINNIEYDEPLYIQEIISGNLQNKNLTKDDQLDDPEIVEALNSDDKKLNGVKLIDRGELIMAQVTQKDGDVVEVPVVPSNKVNELLNLSHNLSGHVNKEKLFRELIHKAYFKNMRKRIAEFVETCEICQKRQRIYPKPLQFKPVLYDAPLECICMDAMGPLKNGKNKYIIGALDCFSRYLVLFGVENLTYECVMPKFFKHVIYRLGIPKLIVTDNARNFTSEKWIEMLKLINCECITNCPQYHNSNTLIERAFRTIQNIMSKLMAMINKENKLVSWEKVICAAEYFYNISNHESLGTNISPFLVMYGRQPRTMVDRFLNSTSPYIIDSDLTRSLIVSEAQLMYDCIQDYMADVRRGEVERNLEENRFNESLNFKQGEMVLIERNEKTGDGKFELKYRGPFKILQVNPTSVVVRTDAKRGKNTMTVHKTQVKHFKQR
uniref:RNA-directed DNA polymerase n=1 Tax=Strongyloides papillosus TaxID=174720 RepID=A0A0N5C4X1_STREA